MVAGLCIWSTIWPNMKSESQRWPEMPFNIGEVWNPVCCHNNKTVRFVLWSTLSRILLQRIKHFWYKLAKISFFLSNLINIWLSVWHRHLANLHVLKTWISLEQKEIFENSKQHFSSHTDDLFIYLFLNGFDRKDAICIIVPGELHKKLIITKTHLIETQ